MQSGTGSSATPKNVKRKSRPSLVINLRSRRLQDLIILLLLVRKCPFKGGRATDPTCMITSKLGKHNQGRRESSGGFHTFQSFSFQEFGNNIISIGMTRSALSALTISLCSSQGIKY
ncbi:hypothetical protein O6H91_17G032900 [Diphasiastrum complanatum]|uniref:Uncharacterized protein n=1 Tax=Diphasiastrum complanatum TaxID=34168 RepID=A0ACC2B6L0_DIPCM|nr:hypothetical protein O6H91_17G032900 [Diphasiastrum complanatum]